METKNKIGTNALITKRPLSTPYVFGENSFEHFLNHTKKRNLTVGIYESKSIAFDADTKKNLRAFSKYNNYSY